jgi:hypothetical protein
MRKSECLFNDETEMTNGAGDRKDEGRGSKAEGTASRTRLRQGYGGHALTLSRRERGKEAIQDKTLAGKPCLSP